MNRICLCGRITKDLELRSTSTGKSVCEFTIAVNRDKDNADFPMIQVWNEQAENLVKYQSKGSLIGVEGSLRTETYDKQDGTKGYKTYVRASHIEYLSSKATQESIQETTQEENDPFKDFADNIEDDFLD